MKPAPLEVSGIEFEHQRPGGIAGFQSDILAAQTAKRQDDADPPCRCRIRRKAVGSERQLVRRGRMLPDQPCRFLKNTADLEKADWMRIFSIDGHLHRLAKYDISE